MASAEKASKYLSLVQDEFRKHSDGSVCKAQSPETCPFNKRAESGDRLEGDAGSGITAEEDAEYMEAVKNGDMEKAERMVRKAAAKAMPYTKVVGENGLPKVVYHGTSEFGFTKFDFGKAGKRSFDAYKVPGMFFSDNFFAAQSYTGNSFKDVKPDPVSSDRYFYWNEPTDEDDAYDYLNHIADKKNGGEKILEKLRSYSDGASEILDFARKEWSIRHSDFDKYRDEFFEKTNGVNAVFLNMKNPRIGSSDGGTWGHVRDISEGENAKEIGHKEFVNDAIASGHDGVIINDVIDYGSPPIGGFKPSTDYIAFNSAQIKSADPVTYDDAGNVIPLSKRFNFSSADIRDEATGRILDIIKNVDAEDASLDWTSGKNPEIHRYRGKRQPIDRVPKKITKQIIVENCKLIKTVDEKLLPLLAGKVYGMLTGKVEAEDFIDWCMDECGLEEWQAYRIARDQIVKAREWIKIADWKHRGVSYVMWCHSGKDAEPRDYHVAKWNGKSGLRNGCPNGLNGFVFNIDNPPVIDKKTGERGLPSTLIGCKCFLRGIKGV